MTITHVILLLRQRVKRDFLKDNIKFIPIRPPTLRIIKNVQIWALLHIKFHDLDHCLLWRCARQRPDDRRECHILISIINEPIETACQLFHELLNVCVLFCYGALLALCKDLIKGFLHLSLLCEKSLNTGLHTEESHCDVVDVTLLNWDYVCVKFCVQCV